MIGINNKETGFYSEGDTVHVTARYNPGLSLSLMKQDDNVNLTLMFNRELGYWPYKIEDTTDFKTYLENKINLFLGRFDLYLPRGVQSKGGSYTVEGLDIHHRGLQQPWYLQYRLVFKTEIYNGPDITSYEIIQLSKNLNKHLSKVFNDYKDLKNITRSKIIKEGKWRRYVRELYTNYMVNDHQDYCNNVHRSDLPF
jgi:hypothetical protein